MTNIPEALYRTDLFKENEKPKTLTDIKVRMLNTYPGMEGYITKEIIDGIYEIKVPFGISIVTGPESFKIIDY